VSLSLHQADVLSIDAAAIVVPVDGTFLPREGQLERILGNIGRQLMRRFPEAQLLEEIDSQVDLPLPLGAASVVELAEGSFRAAVLVSTLHHADHLEPAAKRALVRASLSAAIRAATDAQFTSLATAVLQGGWRLPADVAFTQMLLAPELRDALRLDLKICSNDSELFARLEPIARSLGFVR
jgi:hypothetical protein